MPRRSRNDFKGLSFPDLSDPKDLTEFVIGTIAGIGLVTWVAWTCGIIG